MEIEEGICRLRLRLLGKVMYEYSALMAEISELLVDLAPITERPIFGTTQVSQVARTLGLWDLSDKLLSIREARGYFSKVKKAVQDLSFPALDKEVSGKEKVE